MSWVISLPLALPLALPSRLVSPRMWHATGKEGVVTAAAAVGRWSVRILDAHGNTVSVKVGPALFGMLLLNAPGQPRSVHAARCCCLPLPAFTGGVPSGAEHELVGHAPVLPRWHLSGGHRSCFLTRARVSMPALTVPWGTCTRLVATRVADREPAPPWTTARATWRKWGVHHLPRRRGGAAAHPTRVLLQRGRRAGAPRVHGAVGHPPRQ